MKKKYIKPCLSKVKVDNSMSLVMMTDENTIPGNPPWMNNIKSQNNDPYQTQQS